MFKNQNRKLKTSLIILLSSFVILVPVLAGLLKIDQAHAQAAAAAKAAAKVATEAASGAANSAPAVPTHELSSVPKKMQKIEDTLDDTFLSTGLSALISGASYFLNRLAYDGARWIASGGKGQGALAFQDGFGEYILKVGGDSVADAVQQLGNPYGLNLCKPSNLDVQVYLQLGYRKVYDGLGGEGGPKPKCSWSELKDKIEFQTSGDGVRYFGDTIVEGFQNSFRVEDSDFGIALGAAGQLDRIYAQKQQEAEGEQLVGEGFKPLKSMLSGKTLTPAQIIKEEAKSITAKHQGQMTANQISGVYGSGSIEALVGAASIFLTTLISDLSKNILTDGWLTDPGSGGGGSLSSNTEVVINEFASAINQNRRAAENAFKFLFTAVPVKQSSSYPLLDDFASCPDDPALNHPKLTNCVIDRAFREAIDRGNQGSSLTIREAMLKENGELLHGGWPLISPLREEEHTEVKDCYRNGYCYSNIQKLRKARILPLGFEIAALRSDPDQPWTLKQVVDGFNDCAVDPDSGNIVQSSKKPFCHLIDPNWIIRLPDPRCESLVYGPNLISNAAPTRHSECADISTCLLEDENGQCIGQYGYCLKEKNVWNMPGQSCPAQFSTCDTYTNTKTGKIESFLSRTVDYDQCTSDAAGCRAYSIYQEDGAWRNSSQTDELLKTKGEAQTMYFGKLASHATCPIDVDLNADGCSAFLQVTFDSEVGNYQKIAAATPLYMQKAPNYLGCYDTDLSTKEIIDWPISETDLTLLTDRPEQCADYAQVCVEDEAGCRKYRAAESGVQDVVGIVGANSCPAECVGYDTFKQEESNFEPSIFPMYFIADGVGSRSCPGQYSSCSEFTNIGAAGEGGEELEYFVDIKYCEKPEEDNEKTYYSWEGSDSAGYVLKVHKMKQIDQEEYTSYIFKVGQAIQFNPGDNLSFYEIGSPAYAKDSVENLEEYYHACNEENYKQLINGENQLGDIDEGCAAIYDNDGNIYYRILSETVTVSDQCTPYRKTNTYLELDSDLNTSELCSYKSGLWSDANLSCERCFNGGEYLDGSCVYWTIPSESLSCQGPAGQENLYNGCRTYTGNAVNDPVQKIFFDFEPQPSDDDPDGLNNAKDGWSVGEITLDAQQVGLHSLQIDSGIVALDVPAEIFTEDKWYELTFWARSAVEQNLVVKLIQIAQDVGNFNSNPNIEGGEIPVKINTNWQEYKLGPVQFAGSTDLEVTAMFQAVSLGVSSAYSIDNVRIVEVPKFHRIKNSWQQKDTGPLGEEVVLDVPLLCDTTPTDPFPGEHLGCSAYTDKTADPDLPVYTSGFEKLCRVKAEGCRPIVDTFNTVSHEDPGNQDNTLTHVYNAWCEELAEDICQVKHIDQVLGECQVGKGKNGCYIPKIVIPAGVEFKDLLNTTDSTVVVPADTEETTPIYLTYNTEYACSSSFMGCKAGALEEQSLPTENQISYEFSEQMVYDNPTFYEQTLCKSEELACEEYRHGNSLAYFKDPYLTGSKLCKYRENLDSGENYGWFMEGIGKCTGTEDLCSSSDDCSEDVACDLEIDVPCYDNYLQAGGENGIWSNDALFHPITGESLYDGFVGLCESQYNNCTEYLDPQDSSGADPDGKPYYVIADNQLISGQSECAGQVSLHEGCVLFDQTDNPNKFYDSEASYKKSAATDNPKYQPVTPITSGNLDANVVLKVEANRSCSEWLSCKNSIKITDENGIPKNVCNEFKACKESDGSAGCANWAVDSAYETEPLTQEKYIKRDTSWYGEEYTGYSLFDKYQISSIAYVSVEDEPFSYMAYELHPGVAPNNNCIGQAAWSKCGFDNGGRCHNEKCIYTMSGPFLPDSDTKDEIVAELEGGTCKAFPEDSSPYDFSFAEQPTLHETAYDDGPDRYTFETKKKGYGGANICQSGENCSCEYKKIAYGNGTTDYLSYSEDKYAKGVCTGGDFAQKSCRINSDCGAGGSCSRITSIETHIGLRGLCMEYDLSRPIDKDKDIYPCLTWLPVDTAATVLDPYNNDPKAGYLPRLDASVTLANGFKSEYGQVYCSEASGNAKGAYDIDGYREITNAINQSTVPKFSAICDGNPDTFVCNKDLYSNMFNEYGDYIFDEKKWVSITGNPEIAYDVGDANAEFPFTEKLPVLRDPFNAGWGDNFSSFNTWEDVEGSKTTIMQGFFEWQTRPPATPGSDVLTGASLYPDDDQNKNIYNYPDFVYSLVQQWAWHGGMYGRGLAETKESKNIILNTKSISDLCGDLIGKGQLYTGCADLYNFAVNAPTKTQQVELLKALLNARVSRILAEDTEEIKQQEIVNPNSTVLFTSALYFRDYLYTSLKKVEEIAPVKGLESKGQDKNKWYLEDEEMTEDLNGDGKVDYKDITDPESIFLRVSYEPVDFHSYTPGTIEKVFDFTGGSNKSTDKDDPNNYFYKSSIWGHATKKLRGYHPVFYNYEAAIEVVEDEISKLHYGPMMAPNGIERVLTIDFDTLNNSLPLESITANDGVLYDLNYYSEAVKGVYVFKVSPRTGPRAGWSRYIIISMEDGGFSEDKPVTDLSLDFFVELLDEWAGDSKSKWSKGVDWIDEDLGNRSLIWVWADFDEKGNMSDDFIKSNYQAWYQNTKSIFVYSSEFNAKDGKTPFLAVVAETHPRCTEFQVVYDSETEGLGGSTNKAWTDRVWNYSNYQPGTTFFFGNKLTKPAFSRPFGSLQLTADSFEGTNASGLSWEDARRRYTFRSPEFDGIPYSCDATALESEQTAFNQGNFFNEGLMYDNPDFIGLIEWGEQKCIASYGGNNELYNTMSFVEAENGIDMLSQLFKKSFTSIRANEQGENKFGIKGAIDPQNSLFVKEVGFDGSSTAEAGLIPPQIYSLNPTTCYDYTGGKINCTIGEADNITINRRNFMLEDYDDDGFYDEDLNGDDLPDLIIAENSFTAVAHFFAYADHNRMPIRRVMVDWGDGDISNQDRKGMYKNRKPYCIGVGNEQSPDIGECSQSEQLTCLKDSDCPLAGETCDLNAARHFGNSDRACVPEYFEFMHGYSCSQFDLQLSELDNVDFLEYMIEFDQLDEYLGRPDVEQTLKNRGYTPEVNTKVCVFQPKVQILDNWGWCNGTCDYKGPGSGCYSEDELSGDFCEVSSDKPWTGYGEETVDSLGNTIRSGSIIVIPTS